MVRCLPDALGGHPLAERPGSEPKAMPDKVAAIGRCAPIQTVPEGVCALPSLNGFPLQRKRRKRRAGESRRQISEAGG
jgi:hypothetical protein